MNPESDHAELNARKWDARSKTYDAKWFDFMRYMQKRTIALLPLKENLRFLDLGCGTGWAVRYVASLLHQRGEFYGVDISPSMIERAKDHAREFPHAIFYKANAEELPFQDDFLDLVMCTNSFHHYLHPVQALSEIHRVLKPRGRVYIMDLAADGLLTKTLDRVIKENEPAHVEFHSTRDFQTLFAESKLAYVDTKPILLAMKVQIGEKP